ncbi:MAG: hypothetical protein M3Y34_00305 [Actinomycetota bacterium]|nr:hypothetical protein [Actinomycetota bacterium]
MAGSAFGAFTALALAAPPNGNFERGDFTGWEVFDEGGELDRRAEATGEWQVYEGKLKAGGLVPRGPAPEETKLAAPPQGTFAAGFISNGPGSHMLHRVLQADGKSQLSLQLTFNNTADDFYVQDTLSSEPPFRGPSEFQNQQLRIDLLEPDAPVGTLDKEDLIDTIFRTRPGDKRKRDWFKLKTPVKGGEFRLRIAEVDNEAPFGVGVDAVKLKKR